MSQSQTGEYASQTLKVRRKRGRDPVDTLIVEFEEPNTKRRNTEQFIFRRIKETQADANSLSPGSLPKRATSAAPLGRSPLAGPVESIAPISVPGTGTATPDAILSAATTPDPENGPRRFHLSKHDRQAMGSLLKGGKRDRKAGVAVFVERIVAPSKRPFDDVETTTPQTRQANNETGTGMDVDLGVPTKRKRPGASAEEKEWRAQNQKAAAEAAANSNPDEQNKPTVTPDVLAMMQQLAKEVNAEDRVRQQPEQEKEDEVSPQKKLTSSVSGMKYKPKAPQLRYKERHPEEFKAEQQRQLQQEMDDQMDIDDGDYVYDTYVRHIDHTQQWATELQAISNNPSRTNPVTSSGTSASTTAALAGALGKDSSNLGFLVITGEDEPLWELYAEEWGAESDKEWDTDEDDENAENYYGADYPEDEVDPDDELGLGAYKYRHDASDDEEYDAARATWSDEEEDMRYPWKKNVWAHSRNGKDESDVESV